MMALGACALCAMNARADDKPSKWSGSGALGLTATKGNSDTLQFNANAQIAREFSAKDTAAFGVSYTFAQDKTSGVKKTTASAVQAFGDYKHLFSERIYGGLRVDFFHDDIADLRYRFIVGPLLGYYFIKSETTRFSAEAGPSVVVEDVGGNDDSYMTVRVSERLEHQVNRGWKVWQTADFFPQIDETDNYLIVAEIGSESALSSKLSLRLVLQDKYDNQPAAGKKKNDLTFITALVCKF